MNRDRGTGEALLGSEDPHPAEVVRAGASSPFFLTCEHAGKIFPKRLGTLGLDPADVERHITYDIGAASVAKGLSQRFDAHLVLQTYSRLVVDCNRSPDAEDFIVTVSEDTEIPGNVAISGQQAKARADEIFHPYHDTIAAALIAAGKEVGFHVPVVVRLEGTNVEKARQMLAEAKVEGLITATDLTDAAKQVVSAVRAA